MTPETDNVPVQVSSGYGGNSRRGFVSLAFGDLKPQTMSSEEARRIAFLLLECAESADQDEFLVTFFLGRISTTLEDAAKVLFAFRAHRNRARQQDDAPATVAP